MKKRLKKFNHIRKFIKPLKNFYNFPLFLTVFIATLFQLIPIFKIAKYNYPVQDDIWYGSKTHPVWVQTHSIFAVIKTGIDESIKLFYSWSGVYSANFLSAISPNVASENGRKFSFILPIICILLFFISCIFCFCVVLKKAFKFSFLLSSSIAIIFSILFVQLLSSPCAGFFYYNNFANYTAFFIIFFILFGLIVMVKKPKSSVLKKEKHQLKRFIRISACVLHYVICIILVIFFAGGSMVVTLPIAFLLILLIIFNELSFKEKAYRKFYFLMPLLFAGLSIPIISPGNKIRRNAEKTQGLSFINAIIKSQQTAIWFAYRWIIALPLICAIIALVILLFGKLNHSSRKFKHPLVALVASYFIYSFSVFPTFFSIGTQGATRVTNANQLFFLLFIFFNIFYLTGFISVRLSKKLNFGGIKIKILKKFAFTILLVSLLIGYFYCLKDYNGDGIYHAQEGSTSISSQRLLDSGNAQYYGNFMNNLYDTLNSEQETVFVQCPPKDIEPLNSLGWKFISKRLPITEDYFNKKKVFVTECKPGPTSRYPYSSLDMSFYKKIKP